ncbi:hypothetical protein ACVINI_004575 [Rhizobium beringeri]|jgi:hypothetical protein
MNGYVPYPAMKCYRIIISTRTIKRPFRNGHDTAKREKRPLLLVQVLEAVIPLSAP